MDYGLRNVNLPYEEQRTRNLNQALKILVTIFPQILPEALREILWMIDGDSRLLTAVDQLLEHQDRWVRGRWSVNLQAAAVHKGNENDQTLLLLKDQFRRRDYILAVRNVFYEEFKMLKQATVDSVMVEQNYSYTHARPVLQRMAAKSWKHNIKNFLFPWRKPIGEKPGCHHMVLWPKLGNKAGPVLPVLKKTGNSELDQELYMTIVNPLVKALKDEQELSDWAFALEVNQGEARGAQSLYECECCFMDTTFEQMATCNRSEHVLCFRCLRQSLSEALYGQSWSKSFDFESGQMRCLAPVPKGNCNGLVPRDIFCKAIKQSRKGLEQWHKFEVRFSEENLIKSQMPLVRCPFCSYAEANELYIPSEKLRCHLNTSTLIYSSFLFVLALMPFFLIEIIAFLWNHFFSPAIPTPLNMILNSLIRISNSKHRPVRFHCQSPLCGLPSCILCSKVWTDPHVCYESAELSLRTTIEAAQTLALKRTCPRCSLSFIKESGCNKLTCVCGYTICYTCRQYLGNDHKGEGYRHFCQHFRPNGGPCGECNRCDLYREEDEDLVIKKAGELAESEWRKREGCRNVNGSIKWQYRELSIKRKQRMWSMQEWIDWWVDNVFVC